MRVWTHAFSASIVLATIGCGASDMQLQRRAVSELNCQVREQQLVKLDSRTRIVSGCGRTATYVKDCAVQSWSFSNPCTWRLDSDVQTADDEGSASTARADDKNLRNHADRARLPEGAVGFEFGMPPHHAKEACTSSGGMWEREAYHFTCTNTPVDTGLSLRSRLGFCGGRLCELILESEFPPEMKTADASFLKLKNSMLSKYGPAQRIEAPLSDGCNAAPVSCAHEASNHYAAVWSYEAGESIEINLSKQHGAVRLGIRYHMMNQGMTLDDLQSEGADGVDTGAF